MTNDTRPVVVGIDGSHAAVAAALWAVDEALDRDVPLRLVYATGESRPTSAPYDANDIAIEYGETSLRGASTAVEEMNSTVKIETEIIWGAAGDALIVESQSAAMLCVGSVGVGWIAEKVLGSTAVAVSKGARCPTVIVRYPSEIEPTGRERWVVVGVDDRPGNDELVKHALDEARLRRASVLAVATWSCQLNTMSFDDLEHRVEAWRRHHADVHVRPVTTRWGLPEFLVESRNQAVELVVLRAADAEQVPQIIGPHRRSLVPSGQRSVMIVR